jgi:bla regulator protein blaR1
MHARASLVPRGQTQDGVQATMSEAAPRRRVEIRGVGLACVLLSAVCAVAQAGVAAPQVTNSTSPAAPAAPDAAPATAPAWDVSTVKPAGPDERYSLFNFMPDGIKITNVPLWMIVREAFGLEEDHLFGGPAWAKTTAFDVEAKVAPDDAAKFKALKMEQRRQMMIAVLEERFGLKYHHETRDLPMYELVVAKGGVKMHESMPDPRPNPEGPGAGPAPSPGRHMLMMHRGHLESVGTGMPGLVRALSGQLGRTVIDKTGLTGNFDYKLDWTPEGAALPIAMGGNPAAVDNANSQDTGGPSIFTAVEEQLGLKLESTRGAVDVIVIDQLEQPTAN